MNRVSRPAPRALWLAILCAFALSASAARAPAQAVGGPDSELAAAQEDVSYLERELGELDSLASGLGSRDLVLAAVGGQMLVIKKDAYAEYLGREVMAGRMRPADAARRAALTGRLSRMMQNAVEDQIRSDRVDLAQAKMQLAALVAQRTGAGAAGAAAAVGQAGAASPGPGGSIIVLSGTYGGNCGQRDGNVTAHLAQACNGRQSCAYTVDVEVLGDPIFGCAKDYVAKYQCSNGGTRTAIAPPEAGYKSVVQLSCTGQ